MDFKIAKDWTTDEGYRAVVVVVSLIYPHYCGYVGIPDGHPAFGREAYAAMLDENDDKHTKEYIKVMKQINSIGVHGGITYTQEGNMIHEESYPIPMDEKTYWFGFDACHAGDAVDWELGKQLIETEEEKEQIKEVRKIMDIHLIPGDVIRSLDYIVSETNSLSKQLGDIENGTK